MITDMNLEFIFKTKKVHVQSPFRLERYILARVVNKILKISVLRPLMEG
jgi:hypothetical protein